MRVNGSEGRLNFLRRTAKEIRNYKVTMRILTAALLLLSALIGIIYITATLYEKTGSFTVKINKYEMQEYGLSLSPSREMIGSTSHLSANIVEDITNIAEEDIPENVNMVDGEHNGDNYIAYTFYMKNDGENAAPYEYLVKISNITQDLDEAIRVRLYVNDEATTYAKTRSDGGGAEPGTTQFASISEITRGRMDKFEPGDQTKFTIVIWIEGHDPDCIDTLIGGKLNIEMIMSVVH